MKKYRVWGYETVPYHIDLKAMNRNDAYQKAFDVDHMDWIQGDTTGLWDDGGFKIKRKFIMFKDLNHYRDFLSLEDITSAIKLLMKKKSGGIINILRNNQTPATNESNGKTLNKPSESFTDSNNSFPPPGKDLNITPSKHIK